MAIQRRMQLGPMPGQTRAGFRLPEPGTARVAVGQANLIRTSGNVFAAPADLMGLGGSRVDVGQSKLRRTEGNRFTAAWDLMGLGNGLANPQWYVDEANNMNGLGNPYQYVDEANNMMGLGMPYDEAPVMEESPRNDDDPYARVPDSRLQGLGGADLGDLGWSVGGAIRKVGKGFVKVAKGGIGIGKGAVGMARDTLFPPTTTHVPVDENGQPLGTPSTGIPWMKVAAVGVPLVGIAILVATRKKAA